MHAAVRRMLDAHQSQLTFVTRGALFRFRYPLTRVGDRGAIGRRPPVRERD